MSLNGKCGSCTTKILSKDRAIECEICNFWFHAKCQNVSEALYAALAENNDSIHWYCTICNKGVGAIIKSMQQLETKVGVIESRVTLTENKVEDIGLLVHQNEAKIIAVNGDIDNLRDELTTLRGEIGATNYPQNQAIQGEWLEKSVKTLKENVSESLEIERRRKNIIIHGIEEAGITSMETLQEDPDMKTVETLLKDGLRLDASRHIEQVTRIGKFDRNKKRPIRVAVKTNEGRNEIMKRAKELRSADQYKDIYISPDLTRKQQQEEKTLRQELKRIRQEGEKDAKIKSGKIIKNCNGKQEVLYQLDQTIQN